MNEIKLHIVYLYNKFESDESEAINSSYNHFLNNSKNIIDSYKNTLYVWNNILERISNAKNIVEYKNVLIAEEEVFYVKNYKEYHKNIWNHLCIIIESIKKLKTRWDEIVIKDSFLYFQSDNPELWNNILDTNHIVNFYKNVITPCIEFMKKK
ncbi:hypothetical protein TCON_0446 [Astathelohania contejeani]|uniref:Uncharacterized protein n=1 Tax=Astathelohania contejeani TaxID=164912 RepID=A0ABQ7I1U6_9MICR|nr:hypothetical protein TCON_0446 [Thelohania contejeani]